MQTVPKNSIIESLQIGVIKMKNRSKSRRKTPWDKAASLTETQEFLKMQYTMKYDQRHPDADESESNDQLLYAKILPILWIREIHQERAGCNRYTKAQMHLWKNLQTDNRNNI